MAEENVKNITTEKVTKKNLSTIRLIVGGVIVLVRIVEGTIKVGDRIRFMASQAEYEVVVNWNDSALTRYAIKQAELARVSNVRYIDKIIREWNKKGIKTEEDVKKDKRNFESKKSNKKLFDYDWLNERDN